MRTFVGQVHGECGTDVDARDEPLVFQFGYAVEGIEDDVAREESETGAVHDEEGISFSLFELPLSFNGCACDTCDAAVYIPRVTRSVNEM